MYKTTVLHMVIPLNSRKTSVSRVECRPINNRKINNRSKKIVVQIPVGTLKKFLVRTFLLFDTYESTFKFNGRFVNKVNLNR